MYVNLYPNQEFHVNIILILNYVLEVLRKIIAILLFLIYKVVLLLLVQDMHVNGQKMDVLMLR